MKTIQKIFIFFFVLTCKIVSPQSYNWVRSSGGIVNDIGNGVSVDHWGNSYVAGIYMGASIILSKYDITGNLLWVRTAGGVDDGAEDVSADSLGNCYVTGYFSGTAHFGSGTVTSTGGQDVFVAKYDTNGDIVWVSQAGGNGNDKGRSISIDKHGNSYITGKFNSSMSFGNISLSGCGSDDIFVTKLDPTGNFLWANEAGGKGIDCGNAISVDGNENCYITGEFKNDISFGNASISAAGMWDAFIAKYDTDGKFEWATNGGGSGSDGGNGIATTLTGESYVTGYFDGSAMFKSTVLLSGTTLTGVIGEIFVVKYNTDGNLLWAKKAGGNEYDWANDIAIDNFSNCYITGFFQGTASFGNTMLISSGAEDICIAGYDQTGNFLWAKKAGGISNDEGLAITANSSGNIFVTGNFQNTASFDSYPVLSDGGNDQFLAAIGSITKVDKQFENTYRMSVFPNPNQGVFQLTINTIDQNNFTIEITNGTGQIVYRKELCNFYGEYSEYIDIGSPQKGVFYIRLVKGNDFKTGKLSIY